MTSRRASGLLEQCVAHGAAGGVGSEVNVVRRRPVNTSVSRRGDVMISTRDLSQLPDVVGLRRLLKSMAVLDAILCRDWQFRFYSFNSHWSGGEQMGSMRNGHGDDFYALFNSAGCFLKGFAHEASMSPYRDDGSREIWPEVIDSVPADFTACLREPAFNIQETTFCIWRRHGDAFWQRGGIEFPVGHDPDGSAKLLSSLDGKPETYREWAEWYFNKPFLTAEMVRPIYKHRPLTDELVSALTPDVQMDYGESPHLTVEDFEDELREIGYPDGTGCG